MNWYDLFFGWFNRPKYAMTPIDEFMATAETLLFISIIVFIGICIKELIDERKK